MDLLLYDLIRRALPQEARNGLKRRLGGMRRLLGTARAAYYGRFDTRELMEEIGKQIGRDDYDVLMVHASVEGLRPIYRDGPVDLLRGLRALAGSRTLAMPAFFFGEPILSYNAVEHYAAHPRFDARTEVAQTGILAEVFRRSPGVRRSLHPTHSICAEGPLAERLVMTHHVSSTFGVGSPFEIMAGQDTVILGIGVPYYRCLTQVHSAEDLLGSRFPVPLHERFQAVEVIAGDGSITTYRLEVRKRIPRDLGFVRRLLGREGLVESEFHGVPLFHTTARRVTEALCEAAADGKTIYRT